MNFYTLGSAEVTLRALDRWKTLWDYVNRNSEDASVSHKGFERHAGEYWWLTRTLAKIGQSGDQSCQYMRPCPSDSAKSLHEFMRRYRDYAE